MSKTERVQAVLANKTPDRVPASVWFHFSAVDQDPAALADITVDVTKKYDFDFVKMMPYGLYGVQNLGAKIKFFNRINEPPVVEVPGIATIDDYRKIPLVDVTKGSYGRQLEFTRLLAQKLPVDVPYIQTIFSPLTTLHKLAGDRVLQDLQTNPEAVHKALEIITGITISFVKENLKHGVSGFFFAHQDAVKDKITLDDFYKFAKPYDLQVLESYVDKTWFNVAHIHGLGVYFEEIAKYPVNVINWHDRNTAPSLAEARKLTDKALLGGIRAANIIVDGKEVRDDVIESGTPEEIISHIRTAITSVDGKGLLIGPGCVVGQDVPAENLAAVRKAVEL